MLGAVYLADSPFYFGNGVCMVKFVGVGVYRKFNRFVSIALSNLCTCFPPDSVA